MNIYIIIAAIILFIIILFILFRIIQKKGLKLSLFNDSDGPTGIPSGIPSERSMNIGKNSNQGIAYKNSLNAKSKKTSSYENRDKKPKKIKKKLPLNKNDDEIVNALKKIEPKQDSANLAKIQLLNKPISEDKSLLRLKVSNFEDIYRFLGNSEISDIVHYFESNNIGLVNQRDNERKISSSADFENSIKNKIINFLNNQYLDLRDKVSELRKKGKDMNDAEFILLSVPLKIRLFSANFSKKDFDLVIKKIESIKEILKNYR